jgi:hypothetical protein
MILIDGTYFTGELSLPNIPASIQGGGGLDGVAYALQTVGENNLDVFADKYATDYLVRLFGEELTQTLLEELDKPSPAQIWLDLKDKLLLQTGSHKSSPIANYVYYWLMRDARTKTTMAGEADPTFDNAENASDRYKLVKAWNDMADMTIRVHQWFCRNIEHYQEYLGEHTGKKSHTITTHINAFGI